MSPKRLLRTFILAQIPLAILLGVTAYLFVTGIAEPYSSLILHKDQIRPGATVIEAASVIALLIANIGLYFFWRGARTLYLIVMIAAVLESLYLAPFVSSGPEDFFETAMNTVSGIILGLAYFSPARELFGRPAAAGPGFGPAVERPNAAATFQSDAFVAPMSPPSQPAPPAPPLTVAPAGTGSDLSASAEPLLTCAKCGAPSTGKKFCEECGEPFMKKIQCPRCGVDVTPGKKFCGECGGPLP